MNDNLANDLIVDTMAEVAILRTRVENVEAALKKTVDAMEIIVKAIVKGGLI